MLISSTPIAAPQVPLSPRTSLTLSQRVVTPVTTVAGSPGEVCNWRSQTALRDARTFKLNLRLEPTTGISERSGQAWSISGVEPSVAEPSTASGSTATWIRTPAKNLSKLSEFTQGGAENLERNPELAKAYPRRLRRSP